MAECKLSQQDFIKSAFNPQIAVKCTPNAEKCCYKNNLAFTELLQPFSRLNNDVYFKDPAGLNVCVHNLKLTFMDISWHPPETPIARKLLNQSVSSAPESKMCLQEVGGGDYKINIPSNTPWFESWRETFLKVQYPSDHEFTKHFLACVLIASSTDNNPLESLTHLVQSLNQMQSATPGKLPKWFNANILKYFVILHDNIDGNIQTAIKAFEASKALYGVQNCFLLKINSRSPNSSHTEHLPDPWSQFLHTQVDVKDSTDNSVTNITIQGSLEIGQEAKESKSITNYHPLAPLADNSTTVENSQLEEKLSEHPRKYKIHGECLSTEDVESIKMMVYEFTRSCLMPYVEKQIFIFNDVILNKKGVSKSLFSATKRWFSPNKPGSSLVSVNNLIYPPDAPELQVRRLGDLYFLFGHYSAAFQAYHLAKRDYYTDQAWLYYAGALEMAALAAFMGNEFTQKTSDYMEESITTYANTCKLKRKKVKVFVTVSQAILGVYVLYKWNTKSTNTEQKMPQFATRATLLSTECLKHQKIYGEAAHQFIRMTSEESDLRSALFLEQASYCFLQSKMIRKYAFHMVLAGHRYSKSAQRKHSLKCYKQAYQIYENIGWYLASDHIHYTIGRQANNLQNFTEAEEAFAKLLKGESKQSAMQQVNFLKEYLTILGNKLNAEPEAHRTTLPILPVPELDGKSLKVLLGKTHSISTPGKISAMGINLTSNEDSVEENKWIKLEEMLLQEADGSLPLVFKPIVTLYTVNNLEKNKPIAIVNERIQIFFKLMNNLQTVLELKELYLLWSFTQGTQNISNEFEEEKADVHVKTYKESVTIEGRATKDIVLSLTPLCTGELVIEGFCYTLNGSTGASESTFVKGKQLIIVPGEYNKINPSDQINSNRNTLQITVVSPAPYLQVTFSEMDLDFLCDEVQKVIVDFQNTSSVPLRNIYMATSAPHLLCNRNNNNASEYLCDMTELNTPALREKAVRKNHVTHMPLSEGILGPGQSTSFEIWIRAPSKKGPATIDILVYYENVKENVPKYRLVRHKWNLAVQESIAVNVSTEASHNTQKIEEIALGLKITNLNKTHNSVQTDVTLLNVGLLSKNWKLIKELVTHQYISLLSQESAHILLKARRTASNFPTYTNIFLNTDKRAIQGLTNTYLAFARKVLQPSITMFDDLDTFSIKEHEDGILLLHWQAVVSDVKKKRVVSGQWYIPIEINRTEHDIIQLDKVFSDLISINGTVMEEESSQVAQNQISYNLSHPAIVHHNFENNKLVAVPIKLIIHSINSKNTLSVAVNTMEPSTRPTSKHKPNFLQTLPSTHFSWLRSGKHLLDLKPLTSTTLELAVGISSPGTYDLGSHIRVLSRSIDSSFPYSLQSSRIHSALIVTNGDR